MPGARYVNSPGTVAYYILLSATASVAQLVERWSRDPEDAGSIPMQPEALELHFSQLVPVEA